MLCILTSKHMLAHEFAWLKTMENIWKSWKSTFFITRTWGSCKAREEKRRKKFVGHRLGVTLKSWLTPKRWSLIWNFVVFCLFFCMSISCAWGKMFSEKHFFLCFSSFVSHEPLMRLIGKGTFSSFSNVFSSFLTMKTHAQASVCWLKYTTIKY